MVPGSADMKWTSWGWALDELPGIGQAYDHSAS